MNWFYAEGGQQRGPVAQEEFDRLVATGVITDTTLVWHDGLGAWEPWSALRPIGTAPAAAPGTLPPVEPVPAPGEAPTLAPGRVRCVECGGEFAAEDTLRYGERNVCAACKPVFLQRLNEGVGLRAADGQYVTEETLLARDYQVSIGRCFNRACAVLNADFGLFIGTVLVVGLVAGVCQLALGLLLFFIPFAGSLLGSLITGPLLAGLYLVMLKRIRQQPADIGDAFSVFGPRFWHLAMVQLFSTLLGMLFFLPMALLGFLPMMSAMRRSGVPPTLPNISLGMGVGASVSFLVVMPIIIYFAVCWLFSLRLVVDKRLDFWPAMQLSRRVAVKHWWALLWFSIVTGFVSGAGVLLCCVGLLYTAPLALLMGCQLYQDIFGDLEPKSR